MTTDTMTIHTAIQAFHRSREPGGRSSDQATVVQPGYLDPEVRDLAPAGWPHMLYSDVHGTWGAVFDPAVMPVVNADAQAFQEAIKVIAIMLCLPLPHKDGRLTAIACMQDDRPLVWTGAHYQIRTRVIPLPGQFDLLHAVLPLGDDNVPAGWEA